MRYAFSQEGLDRVERLAEGNTLFALDFDGTLAGVARHPDLVQMCPTVARTLGELAETAPVAIISGRALPDLRSRIPVQTKFLVGNHGAEGVPGWEAKAGYHAQCTREWVKQVRQVWEVEHAAPGVWLEDKEQSLSLHFRSAHSPADAGAKLRLLAERLIPTPQIIGGLAVWNLLPPGMPGKGQALQRLMEIAGVTMALFVGDDETDEAVFALSGPDIVTIRVGFSSDSNAEFFLSEQREVVHVLQRLVGMLTERRARGRTPRLY